MSLVNVRLPPETYKPPPCPVAPLPPIATCAGAVEGGPSASDSRSGSGTSAARSRYDSTPAEQDGERPRTALAPGAAMATLSGVAAHGVGSQDNGTAGQIDSTAVPRSAVSTCSAKTGYLTDGEP